VSQIKRQRWVTTKANDRWWPVHSGRSTRRLTGWLGPLVALALIATACDPAASIAPAPGAPGEGAAALVLGRPAVALDPPAAEHEPVDSFAPAGGGGPALQVPHAAPDANAAAPAGTIPAQDGPEAATNRSLPLARAIEAADASASAAVVAPPALPPAPRRVRTAAPPEVSARYVAVLDDASGQILYGDGEHTRVAPASVTKIATTLVALEREADLGQRFPVTISGSAMAARDGSSIMGLEPGRQVSLGTLLYGMMLPSGNDAAEQVALALGGSRETYVDWMNEKVADLGLRDTHFVNPSGMDAADHYSSAYDMARLGRAAMQHEIFRRMAGAATYRGDGYTMTNLNRLIGAYAGADGIKIGRTRAAGRTIVASATRDGHRVYVSLMRSQDLPGDSTALFNWVWRTFEW
jgi:D-alanyl-D-alanine carboxypeptidase